MPTVPPKRLNQSGFDITALHSSARIGPGTLRNAKVPR
jgi:hypothetical protein